AESVSLSNESEQDQGTGKSQSLTGPVFFEGPRRTGHSKATDIGTILGVPLPCLAVIDSVIDVHTVPHAALSFDSTHSRLRRGAESRVRVDWHMRWRVQSAVFLRRHCPGRSRPGHNPATESDRQVSLAARWPIPSVPFPRRPPSN